MENRFNLVYEPWIPVVGKGKVGLKEIFENEEIKALGGNPVEKIAVFKLLLAIAQSAFTPKDEAEWSSVGFNGFKTRVLNYLSENENYFWLYGDKPFLQMPAIKDAELKSYGTVLMQVSTGNTTVLTEIQTEKDLDDSQKALTLLTLMGFAFAGKKVDNSVVLTKGYTGKFNDKGKPSSGKAGPSLCHMGMLHSFFFGKNILESVYLNIFTEDKIKSINMFPEGIGTAPWLAMPEGEDDDIAKKLKHSYMGRLIPINKFCLLEENGIHYSDGIIHPSCEDNVVDLSVLVDFSAKQKIKWADPEKRPWREITSLLSFIQNNSSNNFVCYQLKSISDRLLDMDSFTIWSGGVRVSSNTGEQYLTGTDDFVESEIHLDSSIFNGESFGALSVELEKMDECSKKVYSSVANYYAELKMDGKTLGAEARNKFWQLCEGVFQSIVDACCDSEGNEKIDKYRKKIWGFVLQVYDEMCPNQTARQLEAWVKNSPMMKRESAEKTEKKVKKEKKEKDDFLYLDFGN